jgi:FtsP/CotA-like multicopper oxidase with cupredoxin domain
MINRRNVLQGITALPFMGSATRAGDSLDLVLATARQQIAPPDYPDTEIWAVNGTFPGPALRQMQHSRFRATVRNTLPRPTALHWHGLRLDNAMDGVPGLTQQPIQPGDSFDYDFELGDAGTFWYHSHAQAVEQVERGLQGPLIVDEPDPPDLDRDLILMLDDIRLSRGGLIEPGFDAPHDRSHAGRLGNLLLTNGQIEASYTVQQGDRLRLRLINSSNARVLTLGLVGLQGWTMALDGMPLPAPQSTPDRFQLAPGARVDLFADVTAASGDEAFLVHFERDGGFAQTTFPVAAGTATSRPAPAPLPPNTVHNLDLRQARSVTLRMEGGAMGGMQMASYQGRAQDMRSLAQQNVFWAFNGTVGRTDTPLIDAALGETVRIQMINDTAFPHAMHLHGMHFSEILPDGTPGPLRDTLLMQRGETRDIAFNAHNPGDWLFHCHMLSHHAAGMGTWVRVTA